MRSMKFKLPSEVEFMKKLNKERENKYKRLLILGRIRRNLIRQAR